MTPSPNGSILLTPEKWRLGCIMFWKLIQQYHIEQRLMHLDSSVVINEAELPKAIHEETHPRSCRPDHVRKGFLRDGRNISLRIARFAKFSHNQQNPRQPLFA